MPDRPIEPAHPKRSRIAAAYVVLNRLRDRHYRAFAAGAALTFAFAFFMDFGESAHLWQLLGDGLHAPIFCFSVLLLWWFFGASKRSLILSFTAAVVLVCGVEIIQPFTGRSASWVDVKNGVVGSSLGALFGACFLSRSIALWAVTVPLFFVGIVSGFYPAYEEWELTNWRAARLPVLADFESPRELEFLKPIAEEPPDELFSLAKAPSPNTGSALVVQTLPLHYSGVAFRLEGMDWSSYNAFSFSVYLERAATLSVRIDDWGDCETFESRFNRIIPLPAGWSEVRIPLPEVQNGPKNRKLDISQLRRILVFLDPAQRSQRFWLDDLKLSK